LREKSRENPLFSAKTRSYSRLGVEVRQSVLGEKLVLAASVLDGQRNLGFLEARLAQPGGSVPASFLRDRTEAQGGKRYCHSRCHFRFDG
jgi:hypothetical protein